MKMMVEGMTCGYCVRTITKAIQVLDASARVTVNLAEKTVVLDGDINPAFAKASAWGTQPRAAPPMP